MSSNPFIRALAILLIVALVTPTVFFIAPQRTSAQISSIPRAVSCISSLTSAVGGEITQEIAGEISGLGGSVPVGDSGNLIQNTVAAGATMGSCIVETILMPIARMIARMILQQITASVISWINGGNGTGQPSFIQNLTGTLQRIGDTMAFAFFAQFGINSNSPFSSAIVLALRTNYLQNTSSAGFFAANRSTLSQSSPNVNAYLSNNWSQGGIGAWFALTTQSQNNPYTLYQAGQAQVASVVGGAQATRNTELNWGQGFSSWCGAAEAGDPSTGKVGTAPGDTCKKSDGTQGLTKTPGSIIHSYTQKAVVDSGIEQLISAQDLDQALGAIIMALQRQILGGVNGLLGASQSSGGRPALTTQLQGYNATSATVSASSSDMTSRIAQYESSWNTIRSAVTAASTTVVSLISYCNSQRTQPYASPTDINAQISAANVALTAETSPLIVTLHQANEASVDIAAARALVEKVKAQVVAGTTTSGAYLTDIQTLQTMTPTIIDLLNIQQQMQSSGGATAIPPGSLTVTGGTIIGRLTLISKNAVSLKSVCTPVVPEYIPPIDYGGGG